MSSSHPEFALVYKFLSPGGDIFYLLTKLDDGEFIYEFPSAILPVSYHGMTGQYFGWGYTLGP